MQILKEFFAIKMVENKKKRHFDIKEMETKHCVENQDGFNDSSYFAGLSQNEISLVTRQAFRVNKPNENWLKIYFPGDGVWGFENAKMIEGEGLKQGNLEYLCLVPGKKWRILFEGFLFQNDQKENVTLDLVWQSEEPIINFDKYGTTARQVGKQVAAEKWSRNFFIKLHELKQVHYEQSGIISGSIYWRNKEIPVSLTGVRDHSWGIRNWEDWDRHIWFIGQLEDGRFFNFSQISYGFVKSLKASFISHQKQTITVYQIPFFSEMNFTTLLPKEIHFKVIEKEGEKAKELSVKMQTFFPFIMDNIYYIRQAKAEFEYAGVKGIGIAEMGINLKKYDIEISSTY